MVADTPDYSQLDSDNISTDNNEGNDLTSMDPDQPYRYRYRVCDGLMMGMKH